MKSKRFSTSKEAVQAWGAESCVSRFILDKEQRPRILGIFGEVFVAYRFTSENNLQ